MIVGVTGTNGAGKGAVVDYLIEKKGFTHYSVRAFLIEEIERRGLPIDRNSMREVANELRKTHTPSYIIELLHSRAVESGSDAVIESIRAVGEAEYLKSHTAKLIAVDADRHIRYDRVVLRGSETDMVDFDTWVIQEEREWNNADTYDMNVPAVMKLADAIILNEGTIEEFNQKIESVLSEFEVTK